VSGTSTLGGRRGSIAPLGARLTSPYENPRGVARRYTSGSSDTGDALPALDIDVEETDHAIVVRLRGELDLSSADAAEKSVAAAASDERRAVILDLSGLRFLDSTGLRLIVAADARARKVGGRFAVIPGPEQVHRVFRIALLDRRLEFVSGPDDLSERTG
jgi:anti-sigma B factor antagonist